MKRHVFRSRNFGILILQGGLGNQLFQISALSYYSKLLGFTPIVYDYECCLSIRDDFEAKHRHFDCWKWFNPYDLLITADGLLQLTIRFLYKLARSGRLIKIYKENDLNLLSRESDLPFLFLIVGSFQDKKFPLSIEKSLRMVPFQTFFSRAKKIDDPNRIAIHLRLTDLAEYAERQIDWFAEALKSLDATKGSIIDCYSDDSVLAQSILEELKDYCLVYPELEKRVRSENLLALLCQYRSLIVSQSSLSWWACFLASEKDPTFRFSHRWHLNHNFLSE